MVSGITKVAILIPAAGRGVRMGGIVAKQYLPLAGMPVIVHTVLNALRTPGVVSVVIALATDDAYCRQILTEAAIVDDRLFFVEGGEERQVSVRNAMAHESVQDVDVILIHDAVRPLATPTLFEEVAKEAARHGAVVPVVPVVDTIKEVRDGQVVRTVPREDLRRAQTPQGFRADVLRKAYGVVGPDVARFTDDASIVEGAGFPVHICAGEPWNLKLTKPDDFRIAEHHLESVSDSSGT